MSTGMSKIYKFRKWLTVSEAAKRMSISFNEEVTESDVLRLALDGHLKLSIDFVNHARARCGKVISWEETDWWLCPNSGAVFGRSMTRWDQMAQPLPPKLAVLYDALTADERGKFYPLMRSLLIDDERFITLSEDVVIMQGVWDLPMIGAEQLDVEHAFQMHTGGPAVALTILEGAFVEGLDGTLCQLQEHLDANEYMPGSDAALETLKQRIRDEGIESGEAEKLIARHTEERMKFLEKRKNRPEAESYYPAGSLPNNAVLVVRTESLHEFEQSVQASEQAPARKSVPKDSSLIATIAALLAAWPGGAIPSGKDLEKAADSLGLAISDDTIRKAMSAARVMAPTLPLPK